MKDVKMMSKSEMINYFDELYMNLTDDPKEAIYMFPNGLMIDGGFDCGSRGEDHRCIEEITVNDRYGNLWDEVHNELGLIRIVPESRTALISESQTLTAAQKNFIKEYHYNVEAYIKQAFYFLKKISIFILISGINDN